MQASNLIYVDQPTGTGFSYTSDDDDIRHDEEGVSNDLYDFLQVGQSLQFHLHFDTYIVYVMARYPTRLTDLFPFPFDFYQYSQAFFTEHKEFAANDFYITGESYAGHYIPAFASRVHQGNKEKQGIHINLKVHMLLIYLD